MKRFHVLAFACILALAGCSGEPPKILIPVTGTVTIDGKPAENIMVQFVPDTVDETINAPTSQGLTDANGKFELFTTKNEKGAIAGPHLVTLIDTLEERPAQGEQATKPPRIDPSYSVDGMKVMVVEGEPVELKATSRK